MDAKERDGVVLSDIPGAKEDVEAVCKDKSGVCGDGGERIRKDEIRKEKIGKGKEEIEEGKWE